MFKKCPKIVFLAPPDNFRIFFRHFSDIFSTFLGHFVGILIFWAVQRFARYKYGSTMLSSLWLPNFSEHRRYWVGIEVNQGYLLLISLHPMELMRMVFKGSELAFEEVRAWIVADAADGPLEVSSSAVSSEEARANLSSASSSAMLLRCLQRERPWTLEQRSVAQRSPAVLLLQERCFTSRQDQNLNAGHNALHEVFRPWRQTELSLPGI